MTLEVIGAGFGRTGTESMKIALELLGYGPCHHMSEVITSPEQIKIWRNIVSKKSKDWSQAFSGFRSTVDWPSVFYWRELSEVFPEAKIVLTYRDAESWFNSFSKTIAHLIKLSDDPNSLGKTLIETLVFGGDMETKEHVIEVYNKHILEVQSVIPKERLLVHKIGSGWPTLCEFLGEETPGVPYPSTNQAEDFEKRWKDVASKAGEGTNKS